MAFSVELVNVNPRGAVSLNLDEGKVTVEAGGTVKVPPEIAGEAPRWRRATDAELEVIGLPEPPAEFTPMHSRQHAGHLEVLDLGSGLLAQSENWRKAGDTTGPAEPLAPGTPVATNDEEK